MSRFDEAGNPITARTRCKVCGASVTVRMKTGVLTPHKAPGAAKWGYGGQKLHNGPVQPWCAGGGRRT